MKFLLRSVLFDSRPSAVGMVALRASSTRWPAPYVDSHGDYAQENFLEQPNTPLYQHQRDLPRLPVPTLEQSIERFLPTALPLAESKDEAETLQEACQDFLQQAKPLQERLLERQADLSETSWLQHWWNTIAYLQYREPIVVHVSYEFLLADDPSSSNGIQRGAAAMRAAARYRQQVCSNTLPQDTIGKTKTPLCSAQYKYMYHACRIPMDKQDVVRIHDPSLFTHAVVACQNQFFAVPVFDENENVLPLAVMEKNLEECQERAEQEQNPTQIELGWLTTWNRDDWTFARSELLRIGGLTMQRALETMESSMFVVCLDQDEPVSYRQRALEYWHGGMQSGGNRWFDKSMQLSVSRNGKIGYIGEHSLMDGMPAVGLCDYLKSETYEKQAEECKKDATSLVTSSSHGIVNIFQEAFSNLTDSERNDLESLIGKAKKDFCKLVDDHELQVESFQGYGSTFIKKAGFSPDAYIQMAIQLATYRLFGKQVATYESTQVRPFLHGRTEVTRSVSPASHAFVEIMGLESVNGDELDEELRKEKLELFRKATVSHVVYIRKAVTGEGCDRHLFGLSMLVEDDEDAPTLFTHPLYNRSKRWRVSTSTLPNMPGFGPVEQDGVGIAYEIKQNCVMFTITARSEHAFADRLCHLLEEALVEIESLIEMEEPRRSKL